MILIFTIIVVIFTIGLITLFKIKPGLPIMINGKPGIPLQSNNFSFISSIESLGIPLENGSFPLAIIVASIICAGLVPVAISLISTHFPVAFQSISYQLTYNGLVEFFYLMYIEGSRIYTGGFEQYCMHFSTLRGLYFSFLILMNVLKILGLLTDASILSSFEDLKSQAHILYAFDPKIHGANVLYNNQSNLDLFKKFVGDFKELVFKVTDYFGTNVL